MHRAEDRHPEKKHHHDASNEVGNVEVEKTQHGRALQFHFARVIVQPLVPVAFEFCGKSLKLCMQYFLYAASI